VVLKTVSTGAARWWTGKRGEWYVGVQMLLFVIIAVGPPTWRGWPAWPFPGSRVVGWIMVVLGGSFALAAIAKLGSTLTPLPYPVARGRLVQGGAYALVRHPIYSGGVLAAAGWGLVRQGWLTLVYTALLFLLFDLKARREEGWLVEKYPEYAEYRRRVSKLIPFVY
jgi:protein-S-isoprenylcysteine O-methyltransferase Ste14